MASVVDLTGIKTQIQTNLLAANTTTASPVYLSNGLASSNKVKSVLKVNPAMIKLQASLFPVVTCYVTNKNPRNDDIAVNQLSARREATITVEVCGAVWNSNFTSIDKDPADDDVNILMENIELTLRNDPQLNGKVKWQKPVEVKYYSAGLDDQTHLRYGILTLECRVFY